MSPKPDFVNNLPVRIAIPLHADPGMLPHRHMVLCHRDGTTDDWIVWEVAWHNDLGWVANAGSYLGDEDRAKLRLIQRAGRDVVRDADTELAHEAEAIMMHHPRGVDAAVLALLALGVDPSIVAKAREYVGDRINAAARAASRRLDGGNAR